MNIRVESAGQCRRTVFVEVPADLVKNEFGEVVQAYSQYAKIPGFRPGRAPRDLVRKRFAKEIAQEVKERLVPRAYQEAVKQQNIQTVAVLDVKEDPIEDGQPFSFTVVVDVTPEFPLPDDKGFVMTSDRRGPGAPFAAPARSRETVYWGMPSARTISFCFIPWAAMLHT